MRLLQAKALPSLLLSAILCGTNLSAQTVTSGGLTGVITDQTGAVLPDADIEIKDNSKGTVRSSKTDREGVYRFFFLAPSEYTVTSSVPGFEVTKRTIPVSVGQSTSVDLTLKVATANTTVAVTTDARPLQTENADGSTVFNAPQIANLPNPGNDLTT